MPRALGGRFEPLDHFVLSHLCDPWASLALRSPHAANRFSGLAIGVRTRSCALRSHSCFIHRSECSRLSSWFPWFLACRTPVSDSDPIETGRWLRTDIKALYCSHQNNDDSKCEAAHASLPDWPL